MKALAVSLLAIVAAVSISGVATAQRARPAQQLDTNGDGYVSKDELVALRLAAFDRADANKDGVLSKDEIKEATAKSRRQLPGGGMFATADKNKDGKITRQEMTDSPILLMRADKDGDGKLSKTELQAALSNLRPASQKKAK
jgi:Ca2+-binding EF-hand superfamily protein